jgi:hypothetical protein
MKPARTSASAKARRLTISDCKRLLVAFQAMHATAKPVKGNAEGAVVLVPYQLSGNARPVLNENIAALIAIVRPHDEAVEDERRRLHEALDAAREIATQETAEDERDRRLVMIEREFEVMLNKTARDWLKREKEINLEPLRRTELNETANAFDPLAFATLLNEGLIEAGAKAAA